MPEQDDYSDAWNAPAEDASKAEAKHLKALQRQEDASTEKLAQEFETAYQAANQDIKP